MKNVKMVCQKLIHHLFFLPAIVEGDAEDLEVVDAAAHNRS